jgi:hypothetical protein
VLTCPNDRWAAGFADFTGYKLYGQSVCFPIHFVIVFIAVFAIARFKLIVLAASAVFMCFRKRFCLVIALGNLFMAIQMNSKMKLQYE